MDILLADDLWPEVKRLGKKATRKRAAVAYVTSEEYLAFGKGDELITDASDTAIRSGQTKESVLGDAVRRGATVYSLSGLHAKVIVLDNLAVIGSANLSTASATKLFEAAWLSSSPGFVSGALDLIRQLKAQAALVDEEFLARISRMEVSPRQGNQNGRTASISVRVKPARSWLIGTYDLVREIPREQIAIKRGETIATKSLQRDDSEVNYIRWTGQSKFRRKAQAGDTIITIWSEDRSRGVTGVYQHVPILHRENVGLNCALFFIEESPQVEATRLSWERFQTLLKRVGISGRIGSRSCREITPKQSEALHQLWKD